MKVRRSWWLTGFFLGGMLPAFAQESPVPDPALFSRTPLFVTEKRDRTDAERGTALAGGEPNQRLLLSLPEFTRPVLRRIERERTPFSTQTRLPFAKLWDGRFQLACVHQRYSARAFHSADIHSTRYQMSGLEAPGLARPRSRENYGVTLSFHFGKRSAAQRAMLPTQER